MEITYDTKADALYILFRKGQFARNREIEEGIILDLDSEGGLLGLEVLEASKRMALTDLAEVSIKMPLKLVG